MSTTVTAGLDRMIYNTTAQVKGIGGGSTDTNICPRGLGFLQQSEAAVAGRGRGGRGKSRSVRREGGGMMSLALHTRLHWTVYAKNAAFPRFRALPAAPLFGG